MFSGLAFHPEMEISALVSMRAYCFWLPSQGILVSIQVWPKKGNKIARAGQKTVFCSKLLYFWKKSEAVLSWDTKANNQNIFVGGKSLKKFRFGRMWAFFQLVSWAAQLLWLPTMQAGSHRAESLLCRERKADSMREKPWNLLTTKKRDQPKRPLLSLSLGWYGNPGQ